MIGRLLSAIDNWRYAIEKWRVKQAFKKFRKNQPWEREWNAVMHYYDRIWDHDA